MSLLVNLVGNQAEELLLNVSNTRPPLGAASRAWKRQWMRGCSNCNDVIPGISFELTRERWKQYCAMTPKA
jgi:hypothetical protein